MPQKLPTGDFKWEDLQSSGNADPNYSKAGTSYNWRNPPDERGCIVECDLEHSLNTKISSCSGEA